MLKTPNVGDLPIYYKYYTINSTNVLSNAYYKLNEAIS